MAAEQGSPTSDKHVAHMIVGVLGGTGDQGRGLAYRLASAGNPVIIGSRHAERAQAAADELGGGAIRGLANADVAREADVVIVAVPYEGHRDLLAALAGPLAGKIVIDCVNPLGFDHRGAYPLPVPEGSAAQQAAAVLPGSVVVGASDRPPGDARTRRFSSIKAHLCRRRPSHLTRSPVHAGAGGARNRAISDRISWNICRGTATSAIWKVT